MKDSFKFRSIPANFADRFPDGDYTIGRGADPRGRSEVRDAPTHLAEQKAKKPRQRKPVVRPAAE